MSRVSLEHFEHMQQEMRALLQGGNRDPGDENSFHGDPVKIVVDKTTGEGYVVDIARPWTSGKTV